MEGKKFIICESFRKKGICPLKASCPNLLGHKRCRMFIFGKCEIENCPFFHDLKEKAYINKEDFCKQFKSTGKCPLEGQCKFSFFHKKCSYFQKGKCIKGEGCPFYHGRIEEEYKQGSEEKKQICQLFLKGECKLGKECTKLHVCRYFLNGVCKNGNSCSFTHVKADGKNDAEVLKYKNKPNLEKKKEVCQDYMNGNCKLWKNCNKLHVCKFFHNGFCKNGVSCGFPHVGLEVQDTKSEADSISTTNLSEVIVKDDGICCICLFNPSTHALVPCGHMIYCEMCVVNLKFCAVCRMPIQSIMKIYK
jgi:hypothetical protein